MIALSFDKIIAAAASLGEGDDVPVRHACSG